MTYPRGLIKSYGSCSRHIGTPFSRCRENDTLGHKKSLRLRSLGETVALPDSLLSSFNRLQKYEEYLEPPNKNGEIFSRCENLTLKDAVEHKIGVIWGIIRNQSEPFGTNRNEKAPDASRTRGSRVHLIFMKYNR